MAPPGTGSPSSSWSGDLAVNDVMAARYAANEHETTKFRPASSGRQSFGFKAGVCGPIWHLDERTDELVFEWAAAVGSEFSLCAATEALPN